MKRLSVRMAFLGLLTYCFLAGAVLAEPVTNSVTGITYPDSIAGFDRMSFHDYEKEHPGLGYSYGYATPFSPGNPKRITATVYAYTLGKNEIPTQVTHPAMTQLRAQTLKEIRDYAQNKSTGTLELVRSETLKVRTPKGDIAVLMDGFNRTQDGVMSSSWLFLWSAREHFMKIRMSASGKADKPSSEVVAFVEQIVRISQK